MKNSPIVFPSIYPDKISFLLILFLLFSSQLYSENLNFSVTHNDTHPQRSVNRASQKLRLKVEEHLKTEKQKSLLVNYGILIDPSSLIVPDELMDEISEEFDFKDSISTDPLNRYQTKASIDPKVLSVILDSHSERALHEIEKLKSSFGDFRNFNDVEISLKLADIIVSMPSRPYSSSYEKLLKDSQKILQSILVSAPSSAVVKFGEKITIIFSAEISYPRKFPLVSLPVALNDKVVSTDLNGIAVHSFVPVKEKYEFLYEITPESIIKSMKLDFIQISFFSSIIESSIANLSGQFQFDVLTVQHIFVRNNTNLEIDYYVATLLQKAGFRTSLDDKDADLIMIFSGKTLSEQKSAFGGTFIEKRYSVVLQDKKGLSLHSFSTDNISRFGRNREEILKSIREAGSSELIEKLDTFFH